MNGEHRDLYGGFSENEKTALREQLRAFMREHPARVPSWIRFADSLEQSIYSPRLQFASAILAVLLASGTGTAFAAQGALPGEPLYGVKVNIEEPITGAFATSAQAKANWSAQLASRRLYEAEQLAVQNKLNSKTATVVAAGLDQATESFDANVAQLATSSANAATVATLASSLEATLAANTQVMNEIANAVPASAPSLKPILASVEERTTSLNSARAALDLSAAESNSEQVKIAAQAALGDAEDQVREIASTTRVASANASGVSEQAQAAQEQLSSGRQNLKQGNYAAALESLQAASVEARVAQLNLTIGAQLASGTVLIDSTSSNSVPVGENTGASSSSSTIPAATSSTTTSATSSIHILKDHRPMNHS